jgi:hypothetical protein
MSHDHDPLRRTVIAALASAPLLSLADTQSASETPRSGSRILVAYFSRSGNPRGRRADPAWTGYSRSILVQHAPKAKVLEGFVMEGEQERKTMERVNGWLSDHPVAR